MPRRCCVHSKQILVSLFSKVVEKPFFLFPILDCIYNIKTGGKMISPRWGEGNRGGVKWKMPPNTVSNYLFAQLFRTFFSGEGEGGGRKGDERKPAVHNG